MSEIERIMHLEQENKQLRKDNETLRSIIVQLKVTLNRLLNRYVIGSGSEEIA